MARPSATAGFADVDSKPDRCQDPSVLAALNIPALLMGVATGGLVASVLGLAIGGALTLAEIPNGADIGLVVGVLAGLISGGWVAGHRAPHSSRFHGAMSGLLLAVVLIVIARFGGSPAGPAVVSWLAVLSIVVSGLAGWLAGKRKAGRA